MTRLGEYITVSAILPAEFARRFGFKPPMLSQWMSGKRKPGLANALALERATAGAVPALYWTTFKAENHRRRNKRKRA